MKISLEAIKALRGETSASLNDVKTALEEAGGDKPKALKILRQKGAEVAQKRADRATEQGRIETYVHHDGKLGVLVEVQCESDYVASTKEFTQFCRDVAMHIAAMSPTSIKSEDSSDEDQANTGFVLLDQPFVKDQGSTVGDLLNMLIAQTKEKVVIQRFTRFGLGDTSTIVS